MARATQCKFTVGKIELVKSSKPKLDASGEPVKNPETGYPEYEPFNQPTVHLSAVSDNDPNSENGRFWTATPSGQITMSINNPEGAEVFEVGEDYYVTFEKAN